MFNASLFNKRQALEAIACDVASLQSLLLSVANHPKVGLLIQSLLPPASMFVVESYQALEKLVPSIKLVPGITVFHDLSSLLRPFRHKAKLLDSAEKSVGQVAANLAAAAESQRQFFMGLHFGLLAPLKRAIQPDLGLSTYDGHIFATTHVTAFFLGDEPNRSDKAFQVGKALGTYVSALHNALGLAESAPVPPSALPGSIEMRDIKSRALYTRGVLGQASMALAAGMIFILASLNNMRHILQRLLPAGGHTQFRLKFVVAYHADSNLQSIQNQVATNPLLFAKLRGIFGDIVGNSDSKWLRKQARLRSLLVHYTVADQFLAALPPMSNRTQAIEHFGGMSYTEMDALLDRHIDRMSLSLERGFALEGDPFWYGRVT